MRLTRRSSMFRIGVFIVVVTALLTAALAANAQSNSLRTLDTDVFVVDNSVQHNKFAINQPLALNGNDTWTTSSVVNAPIGASDSAGVWTGDELIVWGGQPSIVGVTINGGRYSPSTDTWASINPVGAPSARFGHVAVWTGKEMLIWGSIASNLNDGGAYNPTTDQWRPITTTNAPPSSYGGYKAIWTGHEMLVWGLSAPQGGLYDPSTDSWRPITTTNAPSPVPPSYSRPTLALVWTGDEVIAFYSLSEVSQTSGGRYDPRTDTWRPMSLVNAPLVEYKAAVTWTGHEMVVYSGVDADGYPGPNGGGLYNPRTDTWTTLSGPSLEGATEAIWTGGDLIITGCSWYGRRSARYDTSAHLWLSIPSGSCAPLPIPEVGAWTGTEFLIWGRSNSPDPTPVLRYTPPAQSNLTVGAGTDTFIAQGQPTSAFGSEQLLWAGYDPQYKYYTERVLTQFPLAIPSRATVTQATAYLYHYAYSKGATPMNITAYQVTAPWEEGSTWNTSAYSYNPIGGSTVSVGTTFGWYNWNVTSIAQKWVNGTAPNYGLMFNGNESGARNERVFIAREANTTYTPFLAVTYTDPYYAVDTTPPTAAVKPMPALQATQTPLAVQWSGSDQGRGVQSFDVQVRDNNGGWTDWYAWAVGTSAPFIGQDGHTYCFRVRARDYAGNVSNYVAAPDCVTFYSTAITLNVTDAGHAPIADATINVTPAPLSVINIANGRYQAYLTTSPSYQLTITHPYMVAPPSAILDQAITEYTVVLQPTDNVIRNSNFETDLSDWSLSGTLPITITNVSHSGHGAAGFDGSAATQATTSLSQTVLLPDVEQPLHLSFLYTLTGTVTSPFTVDLITTSGVTPVFSTTEACPNWCHQGLDVSAWRNQTVTLVFQLNQAAGESTHLSLDEVTLGTWQTPIVEQVTPARVDANTATTIMLSGQNFLAQPLNAAYITGPIVLLNSTPVETYWINTTTLTATLPLTLPFGLYDIWVANPGGYRGELPSALRIGHGVYLPVISK